LQPQDQEQSITRQRNYRSKSMNDTQLRCTAMQFTLDIVKMMDEAEVISVSPHDFGVIVKGAEKIYNFLKGETNEN